MSSRRSDYEPLAIVGIGCKLPGKVSGPAAYWNLLREGRLALGEIPPDRWSLGGFYDTNRAAIGKSATKWGGFVDGIREFDAEFFGISPAEAEAMDPQQRMLLTAVWEAFQDAGIAAERVRGSNTAVFVGICGTDYSQIQRFRRTAENIHAGTGGAMSIAANRISHKFDFKGPSGSVDTACSSSLVATDLACHAIWNGYSDMAIAGGVNALLDPGVFINFSKANMMSPTGRIRTFDADADGYVRGEGAGSVIIKRLSQAIKDGDRVYSVIRGTCVNQDGQTSTITIPSAEAQADMLSEACRRAGFGYSDIDYVEAHGTGTPVGDPIESRAIGSVFGRERNRKQRVVVGAGKTNTGHLESAAGITGLIKTSLSLYYREIPRNIGFKKPNPNIPFDELGLDLPLTHQTWAADNGRLRRAAVNSFGFGGTNACAVLEEAPAAQREPAKPNGSHKYWFFPFGAQTEKALGAVAAQVGEHLSKANGAYSADDVAANLAMRRAHLTFRGAALAESPQSAVKILKGAARAIEGKGKLDAGLITGKRIAEPRVVFAFAGQGGTWWGMAHELLKSDEVFRAAVEDIDRRYSQYADWSIVEELLKGEKEHRGSTVYQQPLLFALQMGLVARWRAWGVEPNIIIGHSAGELAAATAAGILSLPDAVKLLYHRARLLGTQEGRGGIGAIALSRNEVERDLAEFGISRLDIAAMNAPGMVNVSGDKDALAAAVEKFQAKYGEDFFVRALRLDFAPHSHHMDVVRNEFLASVGALKPGVGAVPMVSTVTGHLLVGQMADAMYWWRNIRDPVQFEQGGRETLRLGGNIYVEIGPHTNLTPLMSSIAADRGLQATMAPSLKRGEPAERVMMTSLATLYVNGVEPKWEAFHGESVQRIDLPAYPWEKKPYWIESEESRAALHGPRPHPLLGTRALGAAALWNNEISIDEHKWLVDHTIDGSVIFPGAGYMEIMFAAAHEVFGEATIELENVEILEAMVLSNERNELVQTVFEPARGRISINSRPRGSNLDWVLRARGIVRALPAREDVRRKPVKAPRGEPTTTAKLYAQVAARGYAYGPTFQGVRKLWGGADGALAHIKGRGVDTSRFWFHPAVFDSVLHTGFGLERGMGGDGDQLYLPVRVERVVLHKRLTNQSLWSRCRSVEFDESTAVNDFEVETDDGELALEMHGFTARSISGRRAPPNAKTIAPSFVVEEWSETTPKLAERAKAGRGQTWLVFGDKGRCLTSDVALSLSDAGAHVVTVVPGADFKVAADGAISVDPSNADHFAKLLAHAGRRSIAGIAFGWGLEASERVKGFDAATLTKTETQSSIAALNLVQALVKAAKHKPRLWLLTRGVQPIGEPRAAARKRLAHNLAGAPLAGFARTALTEHADFHCSLVDLDDDAKAAKRQARSLAALLLGETDETEIALRGETWFAPRLRSGVDTGLPARTAPSVHGVGVREYRLAMTAAGDLDDLRLVETETLAVGKGEIKVAVKAGGLNFRDVMAATGLLPADAESGAPWRALGLECSGVVTEVGAGVKGFKRGDRVMTSAKGVFRSEIVVPAQTAHRMPGKLNFVDAATVPSAFATAYYALEHLARVRKGETVLVHLGTGGVGLAAIQIARYFGATVISTAGSRDKRAYLKKLGVTHVFDSRSLSFAEDVRRATGGRGVDVVLNALAGEAIPLGVAVMAPNGRFVEIGKRDIYGDSSLGLRALRRNGSFFVLDMARMDRDDPTTLARVYAEMLALFEKGVFKALPAVRFPASKIADAFKTMAQAKHIGKVVIDFDEENLNIDLSAHMPLKLSTKGAFLITGGLGGFGAEVARWLADHGAKHLYLMSRSGDAKPEAKALVAELRKRGVKAQAIAADVTKRADVDAALKRIAKDRVALSGVVHSAMVLDDGFIAQLNAERMMRVLEPKVAGAWNLHEATLGHDLDYFIMFSSMAAVLGSSGQANYVAANRFLDILAGHRRRLGLPGQSINWGALGGAGAVQRNKALQKYLKTMGMPALELSETLGGLGTLMRKDAAVAGYCKVDWQAVSRANPALKKLPRFADVAASGGAQGGGGRIRNDLLAVKGADRERLLKDYVAQQIAKVLKIDAKTLEPARPLNELGLDSLTSFQLKNKIESEIGITLSVGKFLQKPTIDSLAVTIGEVLETSAAEKREGATAAKTKAAAQAVSPRQEWLWRRIREDGPFPMHGMMEQIYALKVRVPLDLERVNQAFRDTVARHKVLRSSFPAVEGQPSVEVLPLEKFKVEGIDARDMDEAMFEATLKHLANTPHDIENGPLIDLRVYWRPDGYSVLVLRAHILITDGWSFTLLLRDIFQGYFGLGAAAAGEEGSSYFDYAQWHRKWLAGPQGEKARAFWKQKLAALPAPLKVGDHAPESVNPHARGFYLKRYVSADAGWNAREAARKLGISMHALFAAAYHAQLHGATGARDVVLVSNIANRTRSEEEQLVGWIANQMFVRSAIDPASTFAAHAQRVAVAMQEPIEHAGYPAHMILEAAAETNGRQPAPHFHGFNMMWPDNAERSGFEHIMFAAPGTVHRFGDLEVTMLPVGVDGPGHFLNDTAVIYQEVDGDMLFMLHAREGVFDEGHADAFLDRFLRVLPAALANPDMTMSELAQIS